MAGIPSFFRLPKHKQFNYQPIYYDERKEQAKERAKRIEKEMGMEKGKGFISTIGKGSMRGYFDRTRKIKRQSNLRLILLILFLLFVSYFLFFA